MGSLVNMGTVPAWLQAGETAAIALWAGIKKHQEDQALDFTALVKAMSGLSDEQLSELVRGEPRLAELVDRSWHAAAVSSDQAKRKLLAVVVVRALAGPAGDVGDTALDEQPLLAAAIEHLEAPHLELLGLIARPHWLGWNPDELRTVAKGFDDLIDPVISALHREGLIVDRALGTVGYRPGWFLTRFGRRLISCLPEAGFEVPALEEAEVFAQVGQAPLSVEVHNAGLGLARSVNLHGVESWETQPHDTFDLGFDDWHTVLLRAASSRTPSADVRPIETSWTDIRGPQSRRFDVPLIWQMLGRP